MRFLYLLSIVFLSVSINAKEIKLTQVSPYTIEANMHLVDDIEYKKRSYQALVEIPAGTTAKWEVNHKSGYLEWEFKKSKPRNVKFLGYPGNYGFIPQTILDKKDGGDGDPLDIIVLDSSKPKGSVLSVKIIGALKLLDKGEQDDKIIALPLDGPFSEIDSISQMMVEFPGTIEIVRRWFEGYKGSKIQFIGYMKANEAQDLIEKSHKSWSNHKNAY